jgi:hypothetical protein
LDFGITIIDDVSYKKVDELKLCENISKNSLKLHNCQLDLLHKLSLKKWLISINASNVFFENKFM